MDYIIKDSSLLNDSDAFSLYDSRDNSIRLGIVREETEENDGSTKYLVEVFMGGNQVPVSCVLMSKFGSAYSYEEFRPRGWARNTVGGLLSPTTASSYDLRDGDAVLVAFLDGKSREGVILGSLRHPARKEKIEKKTQAYISCFNGLETVIDSDGAYSVKFQGTPLQDLAPIQPGKPIADPQFNPVTSGSFFSFSSDGSYTVSDNRQYIKIAKNPISGSITICSGNNKIVLGGNPILAETSVSSDKLVFDSLDTHIKAAKSIKAEALQVSIKGSKIAIGNDVIELFDGLVQLIDGLGTLVIDSPYGTCKPFLTAPQWSTTIIPLKIKLSTLKSSLSSADGPGDTGSSLDQPEMNGIIT